eukprot:6457555-Prorocentrum_lima.AAC.1
MLRDDYPADTLFIVLQADFRFYSLPDFPTWYNPDYPENWDPPPPEDDQSCRANGPPPILEEGEQVSPALKDL